MMSSLIDKCYIKLELNFVIFALLRARQTSHSQRCQPLKFKMRKIFWEIGLLSCVDCQSDHFNPHFIKFNAGNFCKMQESRRSSEKYISLLQKAEGLPSLHSGSAVLVIAISLHCKQ